MKPSLKWRWDNWWVRRWVNLVLAHGQLQIGLSRIEAALQDLEERVVKPEETDGGS